MSMRGLPGCGPAETITSPSRSRRARWRRAAISIGPVRIDLIRRQVWIEGEPVKLLHMEFRLLAFLAQNAGEVVSRQLIFEQVWGYYFDPGANVINVHIARLRRKLDRPGQPPIITTVKNEGYRFNAG
jgi:two-component system OmpR family response regulator